MHFSLKRHFIIVRNNVKTTEFVYGYHTVKSILKTRPQDVIKLYLLASRDDKRIADITALAENKKIIYQYLTKVELNKLIGEDKPHQGVIAECQPNPMMSETALMELVSNTKSALILILDGVQDPHNLGACLRSASAFGVMAVVIPKDRAATLTDVAKKAASGAAEIIPLVTVTNLNRTIKQLQAAGIWFIGLDSQASLQLREMDLAGSIGIVIGGEGQGLRRLTRETCDYLAKIETCGVIDTLNVSVATGVALYEVNRQRNL